MTGPSLDHVQIAIPAGGEDAARAYYGDIVGLSEVAKPAELAGRGGCWFQLGAHQLHMGVDPDFRAAKKAHIAIAVDDLASLAAAMVDAGRLVISDNPVDGRQRFFSEDPFGNRIEFMESRG